MATSATPKELTAYDPDKGLAQVDEWGTESWADDGTSDIAPSFPMIQIVQATSKVADDAGKHGGEFWHTDRGEYENFVEVVALLRKETRALFSKGEDQPLCRSFDGIAPAPRQKLWQRQEFADKTGAIVPVPHAEPATCASCHFSQWIDDEPPPCGKADELLVYRKDDGTFARMRFSGTGIKPLRQFIAKKCAPKRIPLCAYTLTISTVRHSANGNTWYEPVIDAELMGVKEARAFNDLLLQYRGEFEREVQDQGSSDDVLDAEFEEAAPSSAKSNNF